MPLGELIYVMWQQHEALHRALPWEQPNVARAVGTLHFPAALAKAPSSLQPFLNNAFIVFGLGKHACLTFCEIDFSPFFQVQLCAISVSEGAVSTYVGKSGGGSVKKISLSQSFHTISVSIVSLFCSVEQNSEWFQSFPFQNNCFPDAALDSPSKEVFFFPAALVKEWQIEQMEPCELSITNAHQIQFSSLYCSNLQILKCAKAGETCLQFTI